VVSGTRREKLADFISSLNRMADAFLFLVLLSVEGSEVFKLVSSPSLFTFTYSDSLSEYKRRGSYSDYSCILSEWNLNVDALDSWSI